MGCQSELFWSVIEDLKKKKKKPYTATETETAMPIGKKNKVLRDQLACICHVVVKEPSNIHCGLHWWLR